MRIYDLKYIIGYQKIIKVDDKLYRGSAIFTPIRMARLKLKGVNQVIDLRAEDKFESKLVQKLEKFYSKCFNIKFIKIPFTSENNVIPSENIFKKITNTINKENAKSYIHCHFGKHRTGQCVAYYQKQKNCNEDDIIRDLFEYGYSKKIDFTNQHYYYLLAFMQKYFPAKKNIKKLEELKNKLYY